MTTLFRNNPVPILNQLPENASSLHIDSFVPADLTTPNVKMAGEKSLIFLEMKKRFWDYHTSYNLFLSQKETRI